MKRIWLVVLTMVLCLLAGIALAADILTVDPQTVTLQEGKRVTLTVTKTCTCETPHKSNKTTFTSSDESVAIVNSKGRITAKKAGTCTVTVTWHG